MNLIILSIEIEPRKITISTLLCRFLRHLESNWRSLNLEVRFSKFKILKYIDILYNSDICMISL